jgi:hypothetical protein
VSFDPSRPASPEPAPTLVPAAPTPVPAAPMEGATFSPQPVVPSAPRVQVPPGKPSAGWLNVILVVAAVVAVGGVAFAVGRNTAPVATAGARGDGTFGGGNFANRSFDPGASGAPGSLGGGFPGGGAGGFNLSGTVQSVTADTLTIATANGQTLEFTLGASTAYDTKSTAAASDVKVGSKVEVQLDNFRGGGRPTASAEASAGPLGTATSVTVVP